jgi:ATP-dependent DNA ligase
VLLIDVAMTSAEVGSSASRRAKIARISDLLSRAETDPEQTFLRVWQTTRFHELGVGATDRYVVQLRPEQVVEVAFDGVQKSSRYPSGQALRFARVLRCRDDKGPAEADTIDTVRALDQG